jgi:hypothetical protein
MQDSRSRATRRERRARTESGPGLLQFVWQMTGVTESWADLPRRPAVYALYGGEPSKGWVAYMGDAGNLRQRLGQHFINRDSSVVTGTSAAGLNIDHVRYVEWWEDEGFADEDRSSRGRTCRLRHPRPSAEKPRQSTTGGARSTAARAGVRSGKGHRWRRRERCGRSCSPTAMRDTRRSARATTRVSSRRLRWRSRHSASAPG